MFVFKELQNLFLKAKQEKALFQLEKILPIHKRQDKDGVKE